MFLNHCFTVETPRSQRLGREKLIRLFYYSRGHNQNQRRVIKPRSSYYYLLALTDLYIAMNFGFASGDRQGKIKPTQLNLVRAGRARGEGDRTCVKHVGSNSSYSSSR